MSTIVNNGADDVSVSASTAAGTASVATTQVQKEPSVELKNWINYVAKHEEGRLGSVYRYSAANRTYEKQTVPVSYICPPDNSRHQALLQERSDRAVEHENLKAVFAKARQQGVSPEKVAEKYSQYRKPLMTLR